MQAFMPYSAQNINENAMQLDAHLNFLGIENIPKSRFNKFGQLEFNENEIAAQKWVIQPKFETPMMNFSDVGERPVSVEAGTLTLPQNFGSSSVPRGMWHQFGIMPSDAEKGIFLEIADIPEVWLKNHYEVIGSSSIYNTYNGADGVNIHKKMKSFSQLMGFTEDNASVKLGQVADKQVIKEAVVAVPYIIEGLTSGEEQPTGANAQSRKQFISIPKYRYDSALSATDGSLPGDSLNTAGQSIRRQINKMKQYVLPPQFDFINNTTVEPIVMYLFEFEYDLDRDDLSYIWQNLAPRNSTKMSLAEEATAHELINTELLTETNILQNPNLRWMVFKVKQKSQTMYKDVTTPQAGQPVKTPSLQGTALQGTQNYKIGFNWPYDYVSIIESIKLDADVLFKNREPAQPGTDSFIKTPDPDLSSNSGVVSSTLDKELRRKKSVNVEVKKSDAGTNAKYKQSKKSTKTGNPTNKTGTGGSVPNVGKKKTGDLNVGNKSSGPANRETDAGEAGGLGGGVSGLGGGNGDFEY
jgi:hypothetical protein